MFNTYFYTKALNCHKSNLHSMFDGKYINIKITKYKDIAELIFEYGGDKTNKHIIMYMSLTMSTHDKCQL